MGRISNFTVFISLKACSTCFRFLYSILTASFDIFLMPCVLCIYIRLIVFLKIGQLIFYFYRHWLIAFYYSSFCSYDFHTIALFHAMILQILILMLSGFVHVLFLIRDSYIIHISHLRFLSLLNLLKINLTG